VQETGERLDRGLDRCEGLRVELAQALREPGGAARPDAAEQPLAVLGQPDPDAAAVVLVRGALDEPVALEAVDVLRHRRRADPLARRQLADPDAGRVLDADEKGDLLGGRSQRPRLAAELPADLEEDGAERVGEPDAVGFQQFVNSVNDS
jgi:hypothetical protein